MVNRQHTRQFQRALLRWFSSNRRSFIWRDAMASPEMILVSEMLLRKTRAQSAEPVVASLLRLYPRIHDLASASKVEIARVIRPLGLQNIRASALKQVAGVICSQHNGRVPRDPCALTSLPHVGRYSANAVCCFAYHQRRPIVDANVVRIFSRAFGMRVPVEIHKADALWALALELLPRRGFRDFNWALLDLGALVCTPLKPRCPACPVCKFCCQGKKTTIRSL